MLPDLLNHLLHQGCGVGLELQLHRCATADRLAPEAAAGEAVNGGDVCRIQLLESQKQTTDPVAAAAVVGAVAPPVLQDLIRFRKGLLPLEGFEPQQGILQAPADSRSQLCRGRIGEGDHQQAVERHGRFGDQPQAEMGKRKRLAGAGAGLEQSHASIERVGVGVEALGHV